jgi:hypothetical protein
MKLFGVGGGVLKPNKSFFRLFEKIGIRGCLIMKLFTKNGKLFNFEKKRKKRFVDF